MRISDWSSDVCSSDLRTGTFHLYGTADRQVLSTSFLALAESLKRTRIDATAVYDYVLQGAPMGEATMVDSIRLFPGTKIAVMNGAATLEDRPPIDRKSTRLNSSH